MKEIRSFKSLRTAEGDNVEFKLSGVAAPYNSPSNSIGGTFRELILPGAFTRVLATNPDVKCLFNHSTDHVLGRTTAGTLKLSESPVGLEFSCQLDKNSSAHRDLWYSVKRGDVSECSFAFALEKGDDDFSDTKNGVLRTIRNISRLYDVSAVTSPAYSATSVAARGFVNTLFPNVKQLSKQTDAELHALLLKHGNPEQQARALRYEARRLSKVIQRDAALEQELAEQQLVARIDAEWEALQLAEARRAIFPWEN